MWQQAAGIPAGLHLDYEDTHTQTHTHSYTYRNAAGSFWWGVCGYISSREAGYQTDGLQTEATNLKPDLHLHSS